MEDNTLSDKRFNSILMNDGTIPIFRNPRHLYDEEDIKAFIKELKKELHSTEAMDMVVSVTIDKLAGDKLK